VGQRPPPCLALDVAPRRRPIPGSAPGHRGRTVRAAAGPCPPPASPGAWQSPAGALRRTWRVSSSLDAVRANDGQATIIRPVRVGSATATLAARLAAARRSRRTRRCLRSLPSRPGRMAHGRLTPVNFGCPAGE
jgi:hypothetical protein